MIMIGMIFQFNADEGTGLIMLSDGQKKDFNTNDWVDEINMPSIGLQILYESNDDIVKVKVPSPEEKNELKPEKKSAKEETPSFTSTEEFQKYFEDRGFDIIKKTDETIDNKLSMGKFTDDGVQSVSISFTDAQAELTRDITTLSSVEEHIKYFKDTGYKLINDFDADGTRMIMFRKYVMDKHSEVKIKCSDEKVMVLKTVNGKEVN